MRRRLWLAVTAGATVLSLGACGGQAVQQVGSAQGAAASSPALAPTDPTKGPLPDPDEGLTSDQRDAQNKASQAAFEKHFAEWINSDFVKSQDLRKLPQGEINASYDAGYATVEDSTDHADLAVLGTVESLQFSGYNTLTTFRVERSAKGSAPSTVTIMQQGGPMPSPDFDHPSLSVSGAAPYLFVGDRAVLLLQRTDKSDTYEIQNYSGEYRSTNGHVKTIQNNQFHDIDNQSEDEIINRIESHAKNKDAATR